MGKIRTEPPFSCGTRVGNGIGAAVTRRPLPHHRAYGSVHGGSSRLRWAPRRHRSGRFPYPGDLPRQALRPRAPPARNWRENTAAAQTPSTTLRLPAKYPAARHAPSPAPRGSQPSATTPARRLTASTTLPPGWPLALPIAGITIVPRRRNPPSCGMAPRTAPPACIAPLQLPPLERQVPDSAKSRGTLPTPSAPRFLPSPPPPPHNPPLSHHRGAPSSAARSPNAQPSPFPSRQAHPEPQSPAAIWIWNIAAEQFFGPF